MVGVRSVPNRRALLPTTTSLSRPPELFNDYFLLFLLSSFGDCQLRLAEMLFKEARFELRPVVFL